VFIGEVALPLQRPSVATTTIAAGAEVLRWDVDDDMQKTSPETRDKLAIDAMLSYDLRAKSAMSGSRCGHKWPVAQHAEVCRHPDQQHAHCQCRQSLPSAVFPARQSRKAASRFN
jgi:hypothetical protein